jgi:hypothetical protein
VEEVFKNNKIPLSLTLSPHGRKGSFPPPWGEGLREGDRTEKKKII